MLKGHLPQPQAMNMSTNRTIAYVMITEARGLGLLKIGAHEGGPVLDLRTSTSQNCEAISRKARI